MTVKLCGKKNSTVYMAEVLDLAEDGEEAHLQYMKKCDGELHVWPNPADESWEALDNILCVVRFPSLVNKSELLKSATADIARVKLSL